MLLTGGLGGCSGPCLGCGGLVLLVLYEGMTQGREVGRISAIELLVCCGLEEGW